MNGDFLFLHVLAQLPCFIWFALVPLLIGLLIGWLLRQGRINSLTSENKKQAKDLDEVKEELTAKSAELSSLKYRIDDLEKDNRGLRTSLNSAQADIDIYKSQIKDLEGRAGAIPDNRPSRDPLSATTVYKDYDRILPKENLQIIEGIGPKIEELLKSNGVGTWQDLADKSEEDLRGILAGGGDAFRMHNPASWPQQARMAANGEWKELIALQQTLDANKDISTDKASEAKIDRMLSMLATAEDDLQIIEGIGPKIERELNLAGIRTLRQLAETSPDRIREILSSNARFKLANPNSWPKQALLAADGKWDELKEYQDYLEGGVDPAEK